MPPDPILLTRRGLAAAAALAATPAAPLSAPPLRFHAEDFATVGIFDIDWLDAPEYLRLLDTIAASPGAVRGVRVFGALNSGARDRVFPEGSGTTWPAPDAPIDLSATLRALDALVARKLTPFLPLTFFPRAVSPSPILPPPDYTAWSQLVRTVLDAVVARYGAEAVARWSFEVWNEPNMPPFWADDFAAYLDLYRATAAAVRASRHRIRLGGPVVAYVDGADALVERFLAFLADEPDVQCDFVSIHRKGIWGPHEAEPLVGRSVAAAEATAAAVLRIVPGRADGLAIVNDEADMKVGYDTPYEPRLTPQFPAYLAAQMVEYAALTARHARHGMRFVAASDNANQHLVQAPFDGRRALLTPLSARRDDLVKLPVWHFYELLRLLGPELAEAPVAADGLYRLITTGPHGVAALFTLYGVPAPAPVTIEAALPAPWPVVNLVQFEIGSRAADRFATDPFAASGTEMGQAPDRPAAVRIAAEARVSRRSGVAVEGGVVRHRVALAAYSTVLAWVTPHRSAAPAAPVWRPPTPDGDGLLLRWTPDAAPDFYGYELRRRTGDSAPQRLTPEGLRGALWVDTDPPPGRLAYGVCAVNTSGVRSVERWTTRPSP